MKRKQVLKTGFNRLHFVHIARGCVLRVVLCTHSEQMCFDESLGFLVVVEFFLKCSFKLAMAISPNTLKKLTDEALSNIIVNYQSKFDNMLSNINAQLTSLRDRFTKMKLQLLVTRRVNDNLVKQNRILERKCAAKEQYSRQERLEILGIPDSIPNNNLELS